MKAPESLSPCSSLIFKDSLLPFIPAFLQRGISSTFSPLPHNYLKCSASWELKILTAVGGPSARRSGRLRGGKCDDVIDSEAAVASTTGRDRSTISAWARHLLCLVGRNGASKVRWLRQLDCCADKVLLPAVEDRCVDKPQEDGPVELWSWCQNDGPSHIITKTSQLEKGGQVMIEKLITICFETRSLNTEI